MAGEKIYLNNIDNEDLVNLRESSTGLLSGGVLSVGTGGPGVATTYDISDGNGKVVTELGVDTPVSWTGLTGEIPIFGVSVITFVAINNVGAVVQQSTPFTTLQSRTLIILGVVVHVNGVNVDTVNNEQHISYNVMSSVYDAMESIGFFNVTGNVFSANGANLTINKSLGSLFKMGSNYDIDVNNPHVRTNAATIGGIFQYRFSDGSSGILTETNIDPNNLDDGAGGLTAVANNQWSVQRIYIFTSNNIKIQRGVSDYASSSAAINGIPTEPYVTEPSIAANGLFRGWLIVKEGATVLNGVDAIFLSAGKFGEAGGSVGSGSVTTLQTAYLNSLSNPEILTDVTGGALSLRRGSAADTDDVLEVQNGAGTQTFAVDGNGNVTTSGTVDGIDVNTDVTANNAKVSNATHTGDVTGDTVLTIATDAVDIPMLSATGTADGTTYLRGDNVWATPAGGGGSSDWTITTNNATPTYGEMVMVTNATLGITLPTAAGNSGKRIGVKVTGATVTDIEVYTTANETLDGTDYDSPTGFGIYNQYDSYIFFNDGTNWFIEA